MYPKLLQLIKLARKICLAITWFLLVSKGKKTANKKNKKYCSSKEKWLLIYLYVCEVILDTYLGEAYSR